MMLGPEFRHLSSFLAVAEECNFSKAALKLRLAQPSLSAQMIQLESRVGTALFIRTKAGTWLTRAGQSFIPYAKEMLHLRKRAVEAISSAHLGTSLPLRFGFSSLVRPGLVEDALRGYREVVPGGTIESLTSTPDNLVGAVIEGRLDAALTNLPVAKRELRIKTVCSETMQVCLRRDDPFARQDSLSREDVQKRLTVFLSRESQPLLHDDLLQRFRRGNLQLRPTSFVNSPGEMQSVVKASGEWGLLPESTNVDAELSLRPIAGANVRMKTGFIWNPKQQNPSFPLLVYRLVELCPRETLSLTRKKKPCVSAESTELMRHSKSA